MHLLIILINSTHNEATEVFSFNDQYQCFAIVSFLGLRESDQYTVIQLAFA